MTRAIDQLDCEVKPLASWRNFKFQITIWQGCIRRNKKFADVSFPKTNRFLLELRKGTDNWRFGLLAFEAQC